MLVVLVALCYFEVKLPYHPGWVSLRWFGTRVVALVLIPLVVKGASHLERHTRQYIQGLRHRE